MKRYLGLYCILFSFALTTLITNAISSEMGGAIPVQFFQEADSQTPSSIVLSQLQPPTKKASPEKNLLLSKASKAASQDVTLNNAVKEVAPSTATMSLSNSDDVSALAPASLDRASVSGLQGKLAQLNQNNLQFQQQTDEQLITLSSNVQLLQQRLQNLEKAITLLNQELIQLKHATKSELSTSQTQGLKLSIAAWVTSLKKELGPSGFQMLIGGAIIILLLLTWICWPNQKKNQGNNREMRKDNLSGESVGDTEEEYDYMGSSESIPAKINLARTYIAMEDQEAARRVLKQVLQSGNKEQRKEAEELLKDLPIRT
ncbi:FimV/HubP family polar landmark protein [Candidatus Coxiella mudrowiae]|uniref:FimV/HubP family polar landmark protein n=1 Tax=Candidatus Coxiella mudrowiae TaxID=2054173 RepID=UPI0012FF2845|nr:FimV/HubP family polar landmark protein [Candidatus Coxiella mudrowiae]